MQKFANLCLAALLLTLIGCTSAAPPPSPPPLVTDTRREIITETRPLHCDDEFGQLIFSTPHLPIRGNLCSKERLHALYLQKNLSDFCTRLPKEFVSNTLRYAGNRSCGLLIPYSELLLSDGNKFFCRAKHAPSPYSEGGVSIEVGETGHFGGGESQSAPPSFGNLLSLCMDTDWGISLHSAFR